ncbi:xylene monooxygenase [Rhodohalobacter sp. SW132]|uniref:ferredoxin reductase family protein n=1 Tax=Rhodohalobacter sp. SW132 TaxID=2293433 RepID=UPI000E24821E|nr:ferric reductase-like transmembrane domain-containing protein [Rhodohalobacter sp. SW132]REL33427.1 xylene monooxygenase [Rhodohalobacter sp. SW132]
MKTRATFLRYAIKWLTLFLVLVIAPLGLAIIGHTEEYRGFWVEFGVALGFIGLAMMGLQFVLTARYSGIGAPFGLDELLQFHANAGYFAWGFIMGHFIILFLADSEFLKFLDPTVNLPRTLALSGAIIAITALIITTYWREKLNIFYEWWRASHGLLALFVVFVGTVHIMQVSFYVSEIWQQVLWVTMSVAAIGMLVHNRVWRPYQMKKRPWEIVSVTEEVDGTWSVELEPVGHDGMNFIAGQFIWITVGDSPFSLQQHPFTISSSAEQKNIQLTIKELGDFTAEVGELEIGTTAFLEGPYGNFTLESSTSQHNAFIIGGIGVTPAMSMLRTLRDRGDQREVTVIYGTPSKELTPFYDEFRELSAELNLNVVHVLEEPDDSWDGETGFIDEDIMKRHLYDKISSSEFFICGPAPMMDVVEGTLNDWGVPVYRLHSERFNIA